MNELNALRSKTLLGKYAGREVLNLFEHKSGAFHIWRGIVKSAIALKGTKWKLGNSKTIRFRVDFWLDDKPLLTFAKCPVPKEMVRSKMFDYLEVGRGWIWPVFDSLLPSSVLLRLAGVVVSEAEEENDRLIWGNISDGNFTVNKANKKLCERNSQNRWPGWSAIWKLKTSIFVVFGSWQSTH